MMEELLNKIAKQPIIPVFYADDIQQCLKTLEACYAAGVRVFEFVNRGEYALKNFEAMLAYKELYLPDLTLGIGTIKTAMEARSFIQIGAEFIVSPIVNITIAEETLAKGMPWIPGCMTPSEIYQAESFGAALVKLFPGDTLGPSFVKAVKPLFPNMKFMVTGGVTLEEVNISSWFASGAFALGLGSQLFNAHELSLNERLRKIFALVNRLRNSDHSL